MATPTAAAAALAAAVAPTAGTPTASALAAISLASTAASTPTSGAASASGGAPTTPGAAASKNTPHLHSVTSSLRSCLDGMLPDTLRNDAPAFQQHLNLQKTRIQSEKNSWRFGLNYLFETLKQHKEWYARNQQFVQLRKDVKRFEAHVATLRSLLSESVSKLDLEAGLRVAELEGRVGAYKIMFEVTKIVTKLSRPLVKLQILKPSESSLSIYCDTFVLDIVLAGGEGAVESASLMTVEKDISKQYPERDEDLLRALKQLAAGESSIFTEKLVRLINRAELAVKYPSMNFEQLEDDLFAKLTEACAQHRCWTAKRAVDGISIHFQDTMHCLPISEPPRKRIKLDESAFDSQPDVARENPAATSEAKAGDDTTAPSDIEAPNPLAQGEWSGSVSFIEWRGEVALHVVGYTPLVVVGVQARRLALAVMHNSSEGATASANSQDEEKLFNDFVSWVPPAASPDDVRRPIMPQLHFARDHSVCAVSPPSSSLAIRQEYSLVTREISGGLQIHAFPIPLNHASTSTLASMFQICGHSLFFHSVLLSAFSSRSNVFGRRIPTDSDDAIHVPIKVDVSAPERITLKTDTVPGIEKQLLVEVTTKSDCSLALTMKTFAAPAKGEVAVQADETSTKNAEIIQKLGGACHAMPLVMYFALQRIFQENSAGTTAAGAVARAAAAAANGANCDGIVALDDDLAVPMKLEGEDMLLDEMGMF